MNILVHGFGPYKNWQDNVTVKVLDRLRDRKGLYRKIFDVRFDEDMFLSVARELRPDVVIGTGQHPRARRIRIERKARNRMRDSREEEPRPIEKEGPEKVFLNLKLPQVPGTRVTYDAGDYVCNYSMYVFTRWCVPRDIGYAFLHIPMKVDVEAAARCIDGMLDGLYKR